MRLYYFTYSFPYGLGEEWKMQELSFLTKARKFTEIVVIPFWDGRNRENPRSLPPSIKVLPPLFDSESVGWRLIDFLRALILFTGVLIPEFFKRKVWFSKTKMSKALRFISNAQRIIAHPTFQALKEESDCNTYWFFYWARGSSDALPFLPRFKRRRIIVRLHGFDVFEYINNGYIPFREAFYRKADLLVSISERGRSHILERYPQFEPKTMVFRLGTKSKGKTKQPRDGIFRIVSCSGLVPVKRIHLLIDALTHISDYSIQWTHIGDGPLFSTLKERALSLPKNILVIFKGHVRPSSVLDILVEGGFDLFINVSESEGAPVSIMEAFSAGIPVMATLAGGTGELVSEEVGRLVSVDITPLELSSRIRDFIELSEEQIMQMRVCAYRRYQECFDMENNIGSFWETISKNN